MKKKSPKKNQKRGLSPYKKKTVTTPTEVLTSKKYSVSIIDRPLNIASGFYFL